MDRIVEALKRSGAAQGGLAEAPVRLPRVGTIAPVLTPTSPDARPAAPTKEQPKLRSPVEVHADVHRMIESKVFGQDALDPRARPFHLLRTQILHTLADEGWKLVGVTSASPQCGKTYTALNLAMSMARHGSSGVLLIDLDLEKPQIAQRLGLSVTRGTRDLLDNTCEPEAAVVKVVVEDFSIDVLPNPQHVQRATEKITPDKVSRMLSAIRSNPAYGIILVDLPPLLTGHEAITVIPHLDCVLFVAAMGTSTTSEVSACARLISRPVARVILNNARTSNIMYY